MNVLAEPSRLFNRTSTSCAGSRLLTWALRLQKNPGREASCRDPIKIDLLERARIDNLIAWRGSRTPKNSPVVQAREFFCSLIRP